MSTDLSRKISQIKLDRTVLRVGAIGTVAKTCPYRIKNRPNATAAVSMQESKVRLN